jgi:hypothetical protein
METSESFVNIKPPVNSGLGSLVNILQQYHDVSEVIYTDDLNDRHTIYFLLNLFEGKLKQSNAKPDNLKCVVPTWQIDAPNAFGTSIWSSKSYKKAVGLPQIKNTHVVCDFDRISDDSIKSICKSAKKIYNIGNRKANHTEDCSSESLSVKYKLLSTACAYIGTDGGMSHLALMTNTPTCIIYNEQNPWFFYPDNANIANLKTFIKSLVKI